MTVTLRFLGTGAAEPVPTPGCACPACAHARAEPAARRMQSGVALATEGGQYLVDCGPAVVASSGWLDAAEVRAVLLSHLHPDHALGLYSLRWAPQERPIPVFLPQVPRRDGAAGIEGERVWLESWLALEPRVVEPFAAVRVGELTALTLELAHGDTPTQGFLLELAGVTVAYLLDGKGLPERALAALRARGPLDAAIVDATYRPGRRDGRHNNLDEAIELGLEIGARRVFLSHIGHHNLPQPELEAYVRARTPAGDGPEFVCARDGLTLTLEGDRAAALGG